VKDTISWDFSIPSGYIIDRQTFSTESIQVHVTRVIDGDTIEIRLKNTLQKVRLLGVDTPETVHPYKPLEIFGQQASDYTRRHIEGQSVWLTFDREPIDKYGRKLAYVWM